MKYFFLVPVYEFKRLHLRGPNVFTKHLIAVIPGHRSRIPGVYDETFLNIKKKKMLTHFLFVLIRKLFLYSLFISYRLHIINNIVFRRAPGFVLNFLPVAVQSYKNKLIFRPFYEKKNNGQSG